jgi:TIR domain
MKAAPQQPEVTRPQEVFISSREDQEFVRRLDTALKARSREAWIDWEGIRPGEEFMQAMFAAIEGAWPHRERALSAPGEIHDSLKKRG